MPQKNLVKLKSTKSKTVLWTRRKKTSRGAQKKEKLEVVKFDKALKQRVPFKEAKK